MLNVSVWLGVMVPSPHVKVAVPVVVPADPQAQPAPPPPRTPRLPLGTRPMTKGAASPMPLADELVTVIVSVTVDAAGNRPPKLSDEVMIR